MTPRPFVVVECEQRTPPWYAARVGRVTASKAGDMLARTKSGWAASRDNYKWQLVLERLTGRPQEREFQSAAMLQGIEREALAVGAYEAATGNLVKTCGFLQHTDLLTGASLDGYLGDFDALVSVKCREAKAHAEHVLTGAIPKSALEQMRHELWLTGASMHQYVSFNPDFPESLQLRIVSVLAEEQRLDEYEAELLAFLAEVDLAEDALRKKVV